MGRVRRSLVVALALATPTKLSILLIIARLLLRLATCPNLVLVIRTIFESSLDDQDDPTSAAIRGSKLLGSYYFDRVRVPARVAPAPRSSWPVRRSLEILRGAVVA